FECTLPSAPDSLGCRPSARIRRDYLASSGVQLPVQPDRRRNRGIHYKGLQPARGAFHLHPDEDEMRLESLLPLTPTVREYGRQTSKGCRARRRGGNTPGKTMDRVPPPGSA